MTIFLIIDTDSNLEKMVEKIVGLFREESGGLNFTWELPLNNCIQFLDILILFSEEHVCWQYCPRTKKSLVLFESAHSKLVKRGIALTCLSAALEKSCNHQMKISFERQSKRLTDAGYPPNLISSCCESLLQKLKRSKKGSEASKERKRVQVIPYMHTVSHNLKKVAGRYDVNVVFSAPCKLARICPML